MADVSAFLRSWSATASSNGPQDSATIGSGLGGNLRATQAVVRQFLASYGSNIASAATMDLTTMDGYVASVTGNTTVTGLGTEVSGISYWLVFASTPMFKNSATLITGADVTFAAGDIARFTSEGSAAWRMTSFYSAAGMTGTGAKVRAVSPTFTGVPLAPTATAGTNTTQLATTAFVSGISSPTVQVYTTTGSNSWAKPANLKHIIVRCLGAGGGGGATVIAAGGTSGGGGGAAGGYCEKLILASSLAASVTATVGAGGGTGASGGLSAFQGWCTATGGAAGAAGGADTVGSAASGGAGANGDINGAGANAKVGFLAGGVVILSGGGGDSILGGGGNPVTPASVSVGNAATGKGAGGGGGATNAADRNGGAGSNGLVIVYEFYT